MKKIIIIGISSLLIFLFTMALGGTTRKDVQKQKVTVLLDWFPNTNHTGLYVAKEHRYFNKQKLDVEILAPGEGEHIQAIAGGIADFGISSQESVTLARAAGIPIVSVAAVMQHNTSAFASLSQSGINRVKDFEGKRYGGWGSPIEEAVIQAVMEDAEADYTKIKNITIGTVDFFQTIGKESDFQWIFYGWDGIEAKRRGINLDTIFLKDLNPILDYYTPVIITNEDHVKNQKELVQRWMKAVQEGYAFSIQYPQQAADILIKSVPEINAELVKQSQPWVSSQYQAEAKVWGVQREDVWRRYSEWLYDHRLIKNKIVAQDAFTNEFINEATPKITH